MKDWYQRHRILVWLFLFGFGIRFVYALAIQITVGSQGFTAYSDAAVYLREAHNLLEHHILSQNTTPPFLPDALRTPLYPLFLALGLILKLPLLGIIILQNIMAGFMNVMMYRLGIILFKKKWVGIVAAVLMSIEPMSVYWNNLTMSDYLFSFLFLWSVLTLFQSRPYRMSFLLGLATLVRPIGLYFFLPSVLILLFQKRQQWREKHTWLQIVGCIGIVFLCIVPWMIRNATVFGTASLSSAGWFNLHEVTLRSFAEQHGIPFSSAPYTSAADPNGYHFANVPFYQEDMKKTVQTMPWTYAQFHISTAWQGLFDHDYDYLAHDVIRVKLPALATMADRLVVVGNVWWLLIYGMSVIGIFAARRDITPYFFLLCIGMNLVLVGALSVQSGSRFNLPVMPFFFLLAGYGIVKAYERIHSRTLS